MYDKHAVNAVYFWSTGGVVIGSSLVSAFYRLWPLPILLTIFVVGAALVGYGWRVFTDSIEDEEDPTYDDAIEVLVKSHQRSEFSAIAWDVASVEDSRLKQLLLDYLKQHDFAAYERALWIEGRNDEVVYQTSH